MIVWSTSERDIQASPRSNSFPVTPVSRSICARKGLGCSRCSKSPFQDHHVECVEESALRYMRIAGARSRKYRSCPQHVGLQQRLCYEKLFERGSMYATGSMFAKRKTSRALDKVRQGITCLKPDMGAVNALKDAVTVVMFMKE